MKESFENKLHQFRDVIETPKKESNKLNKSEIKIVKEWALKQASEKGSTNIDAQRRIFVLQQRKQDLMDDLKKKLKSLEKEEYESIYPKSASLISQNEKGFIVGERQISMGELMSDIDWGTPRRLDKSIPYIVHKKYLIEQAKSRISPLLDEQIIEEEVWSSKTDEGKKKAYKKLRINNTKERFKQSGVIAEKMVKSFLKKIAYDIPEAGFEIVEADVEHDVNRKIDFILIKKDHDRGVGVETKHVTGFQFTINSNPEVINHKLSQLSKAKKNATKEQDVVDRIQDIVLVTASIDDIQDKYKQWNHIKKLGGPDQYWSTETKIKIIENILKGFLDIDTIEKIKQSIVEKENAPQMAEA